MQLTGEYAVWQERDRHAALVLGIGYERTDFEDSQRLANHVRVDYGPLLLAGVKVGF